MGDLLLADEPPPKRTRPRWVDGLGLTAIVLGIVAIGLLGDRGSKDPAGPPPPTTTTSAFRRGTPYASTTTTRPLPTSTTVPTLIGRMFDRQTDTALLLADGQTWRAVDLDAGTVRTVAVPSGYSTVATRAGLLVASPQELRFVRLGAVGGPLGQLVTSVVRPLPDREHLLTPAGLDHAWLTAQEGVDVVTGQVDADGTDTGRVIRLAPQALVVAGLDDGVVVSQGGSLTVVPVAGPPRSLGTGTVLGASGDTVVRTSCALLRCRLELVDTSSGHARRVTGLPEPQAGIGGPGAATADGRWIATIVHDAGTGYADLVAIDVATGRGHVVATGVGGPIAVANTGADVFWLAQARLWTQDLDTARTSDLGVDVSRVGTLVAVPAP